MMTHHAAMTIQTPSGQVEVLHLISRASTAHIVAARMTAELRSEGAVVTVEYWRDTERWRKHLDEWEVSDELPF